MRANSKQVSSSCESTAIWIKSSSQPKHKSHILSHINIEVNTHCLSHQNNVLSTGSMCYILKQFLFKIEYLNNYILRYFKNSVIYEKFFPPELGIPEENHCITGTTCVQYGNVAMSKLHTWAMIIGIDRVSNYTTLKFNVQKSMHL